MLTSEKAFFLVDLSLWLQTEIVEALTLVDLTVHSVISWGPTTAVLGNQIVITQFIMIMPFIVCDDCRNCNLLGISFLDISHWYLTLMLVDYLVDLSQPTVPFPDMYYIGTRHFHSVITKHVTMMAWQAWWWWLQKRSFRAHGVISVELSPSCTS